VEPGRGNGGGEAEQQGQRVEVDGVRPVRELALEGDAHFAVGGEREPVVGDRRAECRLSHSSTGWFSAMFVIIEDSFPGLQGTGIVD